MNRKHTQNTWGDIKTKIKTKWSSFNDYEVESFQGNLENITQKLQKAYGYSRERAEREFNDFKASLQTPKSQGASVAQPVKTPVPELNPPPQNIDEMDMAQPAASRDGPGRSAA